MKRREFLAVTAAAPLLAQAGKKRIACLSSTYHVRSHSDNFITRFLEGYWIHEKYYEPPFEVASLWMDQMHPGDIGQRLAKAYGVPVRKTYRRCADARNGQVSPSTASSWCASTATIRTTKNSSSFIRAIEFFEQVVKVFKDSGRSCPVFVDKHLSYDWKKAKQMYDWSRELKFPLMAGSSVPVTFRRPEYDPPLGVEMESALKRRRRMGGRWRDLPYPRNAASLRRAPQGRRKPVCDPCRC